MPLIECEREEAVPPNDYDWRTDAEAAEPVVFATECEHDAGRVGWPSLDPSDPECDVLVNVADLEPPDPQALLALWWDLLYPAAVSVLAGPPSIGKTTYTRRVVATVAAGRRAEFLGWPGPSAPINVFVMDYETPPSEHHQAWEDAFADHQEAKHRVTLCKAESALDVTRLARFVKEFNIGLIIIDTLSAAFNFAEINSNSETERAMKQLRWLARSTGASVLVLAHCPKGRIDLIGAQAQKAAADIVKFYEAVPEKASDGDLFRISGQAIGGARGKSRFGKMLEMTFSQSGAGHFDLASGGVTHLDAKASVGKVAEYVRNSGERGASTTEILEGTGIASRTTVHNAIKELREASRISVTGQGKATRFLHNEAEAES